MVNHSSLLKTDLAKISKETFLIEQINFINMKKIFLLIAISIMAFGVNAQTEYMIVTKKDGTATKVKVNDVDEISFDFLFGEAITDYAEDGTSVKVYDLEINPVSKQPALLLNPEGKASSLIEFDGSAWVNVGPKGFTGDIASGSASLAYASDGTPYAFFKNSTRYSHVFKYSGGAWSSLGNEFGSDKNITETFTGIALDSDDYPIVSYMYSANGAAVARRTLVVNYFDGDGWIDDQTIPGVSANNYLIDIFNAAGSVYVGFLQQGVDGYYALYKYNGEFSWTEVTRFLPEGAVQGNIIASSWVVSDDGNEVFLLAGVDNITNGVFYPTVFRYRVDTDKWSQIGEPVTSAGGEDGKTMQTASRFDMTLDSKGNPMLFYKDYDNNDYPTVLTLNDGTRQWNDPVVIDNYSISPSRMTIKSIEPGVQYASYVKNIDGVKYLSVVKLEF